MRIKRTWCRDGKKHSLQEKAESFGGEEGKVQSRREEEMLGPPPQATERKDRGHGRSRRREWVLIRTLPGGSSLKKPSSSFWQKVKLRLGQRAVEMRWLKVGKMP